VSGWIGVDLDGTLAKYDGWKGELHIGEPVPEMVFRVHKWLAEGRAVKIFTARVAPGAKNLDGSPRDLSVTVRAIHNWCVKHIGTELEITCVKDFGMVELWDDRCVQVETNTGRPIGQSTRGLS